MTEGPAVLWQAGSHRLSLDRPQVMGVLNVTPDSFSDGGDFISLDSAVRHASELEAQGADIIDVGGESTRPGAEPASQEQEFQRVIPVVEALRQVLSIPISVDTSKPEIMTAAIEAGASIINDVAGFRAEGAIEAVADAEVGLCVMHMLGEPRTMQKAPEYRDPVKDICGFLIERTERLEGSGIKASRICIDPGFGFGKTLEHNLALMRGLPVFVNTGYPVLVGVSRKSMIGQITGRDVHERMVGSVSAAVLAATKGAQIVRVHDVRETVDALKVLRAIEFGE